MKRKIVGLVLSYSIVVNLLLASCTPAVTEVEEEVAAELSFSATTYVNEQYGFSIKYPAEYEEEAQRSNEVFRARPPARFPLLAISVLDAEVGTTFDELRDTFKSGLTLAGIADVEFVFEKEGTLSDGVTPAYELEIEYQYAGYDLRALYLWVVKHNKWFLVAATTMADPGLAIKP